MLQYRIGNCSNCPKKGVYIVKRTSTMELCQTCNKTRLSDLRTRNPKVKPTYPKQNKRAETGLVAFFTAIWNTRPHVSFVSGQYLGEDANVCFMAHVIAKGQNKYPLFSLYDKNLVLLSFEEHHLWDHGSRSDLRLLPEWDKLFTLEAELKEEYVKLKR